MISVCIPTYEQAGYGWKHLNVLLSSIVCQRGAEFEVIVSDNSSDSKVREVCKVFCAPGGYGLPLRYVHNEVLGISNNTNNAIAHASYELIKIMYQDDLFIHDRALQLFEQALAKKPWAVASFLSINENGQKYRRHDPVYPENMLHAKNTIGMPSVLGMRRNGFLFDPNLRTRLDCEYYWLLHREYGDPEYIRVPLIGCRYWRGSASRRQGNCTQAEREYIRQKHGVGHDGKPLASTE